MTRIAFALIAVFALAACDGGSLYATSPGSNFESSSYDY